MPTLWQYHAKQLRLTVKREMNVHAGQELRFIEQGLSQPRNNVAAQAVG